MTARQPITTAEWAAAGYPFELWLRYAAADERTQVKAEELFARTSRPDDDDPPSPSGGGA